jgi:hypothetical protein
MFKKVKEKCIFSSFSLPMDPDSGSGSTQVIESGSGSTTLILDKLRENVGIKNTGSAYALYNR